jgi:DNA-binding NarL/FixJ family response regulator
VVRVLLVDDHAMVRDGLKRLIDEQAEMEVVAEAADGREALRLAERSAPDVALIDVSMPGWDGPTLAQELTRRCPRMRLIAVTRHDEDVFVKKMLTAGVMGYILKQSAGSELVHAVREVADGRPYIDPSVRTLHSTQTQVSTINDVPATEDAALTTAEEQVLRLIAAAWTHQRIAEHLSADVSVVLALRASAMRKAGLATRTQIINYARMRGWLRDR